MRPEIATRYRNHAGKWVEVPAPTIEAVGSILAPGIDPALQPVVVREGTVPALPDGTEVVTEEGETVEVPDRLPLGYHQIDGPDGPRPLVVGPARCYLEPTLRIWGWALQLYGLWSGSSWGIGDLRDLRSFGAWARSQGASVALINPLHAATPVSPRQPSPYYPSSRCFYDPLTIAVEEVAGAPSVPEVARSAERGRVLAGQRVDRDRVAALKMPALEALWELHRERVGRSVTDDPAHRFATFCVLAERHGADWREWPASLRDPASSDVAAFASEMSDRIAFHAWLQTLVEEQLAAAGAEVGIVNDLAIGVDPGGADAWMWQDAFITGATIGAPPDDYSLQGQDWGITGFDPNGLKRTGYAPFIETVRASLRHAAGMRFDHVMGLFRLYWIPEGAPATDGAYVAYPSDDLLTILALESHRSRAFVVGEDLGTVEPIVREEMAARDMLSYRLLWFLDDDVDTLPFRAMASANTHDLPTTAGLWSGDDLVTQEELGHEPAEAFVETMIARVMRHLDIRRDASLDEVIRRSAEVLAATNSALVTVGLDDAVLARERYNFPGRMEAVNWTTVLPESLGSIVERDAGSEIAQIMKGGGR